MGSNQYNIKIKVSTDGITEVVSLGKNFKTTGTEIETAAAKIAKIDAFAKLKKEVTASEAAWKKATATVGILAREIAASENPTKKQTNAFNRAKKSASSLKTAYEKNRLALNSMRKGLAKAGVNTTKLASEQKKLKVEVDRSREAIEQAAKVDAARGVLGVRAHEEVRMEITRLNEAYEILRESGTASVEELYQAEVELRQRTSELRDETDGWAESITRAQAGLVALAAIGYTFIQSMGNYSVFAQKMAEVSTLIDVTDEELQQLGETIRDVTREIPQAAHELAAAEYDILSAGVALEKSTAVLIQSAKAAVAGVTDTKTAANVGIGVVNAYGMEIGQLGNVYDVLFTTVKKGVTTFPELAQNIGDILPIARSADVDFRNVAASISVMTKMGIQTPKAATALVGAITAMSAPAPEAKKKFEELGITWKGLIPTLEQIAAKSLTMDQMRELIPDKEARVGVLTLTQSLGLLTDTLGEMNDVSGATDEAFNKMKNTPENQLKLFRNEVDTLASALGKFLTSAGAPALKFFRELSVAIRKSDIITQAYIMSMLGAGVGFALWKLGLASIYLGLKRMIIRAHAATVAVDVLAASSIRLSIALRATLAGAIIFTGVKTLQLVDALWELKKAKDAAFESTQQHAELESRLAKRLAETSEALGIQITSMEEFNRLQKEGLIYFDEATRAWKKRDEAAQAALEQEVKASTAIIDGIEARAKAIISTYEAETQARAKQHEQQLLDLELAEAKGEITKKESAARRLEIEQAYHLESLAKAKEHQRAIRFAFEGTEEEKQEAVKASSEEIEKLEIELKKFRIKEITSVTEAQKEEEAKRVKAAEESAAAIVKIATDEAAARSTALAAYTAGLELEEAKGLITHEEFIEKKRDAEIEFAKWRIRSAEEVARELAATGKADTDEYTKAVEDKKKAQIELIKLETEAEKAAIKSADAQVEAQKKVKDAVHKTYKAVQAYVSTFDKAGDTIGELLAETEKFEHKLTQNFGIGFGVMRAQYALTTRKLHDMADKYQAVADEAGGAGLAVDFTSKAFKAMTLDGFTADVKSRVEGLQRYQESLALVRDEINDLTSDTSSWSGATQSDMATAEEAYLNAKDTLGSTLDQSRDLWRAYANGSKSDADAMAKGIISSYQSMASSGRAYIDALKGQWQELQEKIREVKGEIIDLIEKTEESIRDLEMRLLDDQEKWQANLARYNELYGEALSRANAGLYEEAKVLFEEAMAIAEKLAVAVKDKSDNVVSSLSDNTTMAIGLITKASDAAKDALSRQASDMAGNQAKVRSEIDKTASSLSKLQQQVSDFNQKAWEWAKGATMSLPQGFNSGGTVPGVGSGDIIPAMLTPKEYVQPVPAVNKYGVDFMERIRRRQLPVDAVRALMSGRGYNLGGLVARRPLTVDLPRLNFNAGGQVPSAPPEQITERIEVTLVVNSKKYPGIFEKSAGREFISELGKAKNISIG